MSNIVNDMRTFLLSRTTVTALTGNRIVLGEIRQNSTLPAVAINLIDSQTIRNLVNADGLRRSTVQIDCYGTSTGFSPYQSAYTVTERIRKQVEMYKGTMGSSNVRRAYVDDQRDFEDEPDDGSGFSRRGRSLDVVVWHVESLPST